MKKICLIVFAAFSLISCSKRFYIVRHAEKAVAGGSMTEDVALSETGNQRAEKLKEVLRNKRIKSIYSTNFNRTRSTAEPLRALNGLDIKFYGPMPDSAFIRHLKSLNSNTLIVGHSNTVDNIVNGLTGKNSVPGDLNESAYDNLFVVKYKRFPGKRVKFEKKMY